uniref:Uncharacterized protein n=1 Tax=Janibacter limosus TaxID=53458 RepID=A0AC61U1B3_9MICO|nr:hypothetical protein [Janibacter limosus]
MASATPVGEGHPIEDGGHRAVDVAPQEAPAAGVLDEVGLPGVDPPPPRGVAEPDGAVGGHRRVVGEEHRRAIDMGHELLDATVPVDVDREQAADGVAHEEASVGQPLRAQWPAPGLDDPLAVPTVRRDGDDRAVHRARPHPRVRADEHVLGTGAGDRHPGERDLCR